MAENASAAGLCCEFLDDLPSEILLHICSFLDAVTILRNLRFVSEVLHEILENDQFWRIRICKRWPGKYPAIPVNENEFNFKEACIKREQTNCRWRQNGEGTEFFQYQGDIFGSVDSVHLMKDGRFLASGSRDRVLNVLDISALSSNDPECLSKCNILSKDKLHSGWIWCIDSVDNHLFTGSWDANVAIIDLEAEGSVLHKIKIKSPALSMHCEPNEMFVGTFAKQLFRIDPRSAQIISQQSYQSGAVLSLVGTDKYIFTGSEDGTVAVFDRRASAVLDSFKFEAGFPTAMSLTRDELWIGDKKGNLYLFDASDGLISPVQEYPEVHVNHITGLHHSDGELITSSVDGAIQIRQPSLQPDLISVFHPDGKEVVRMHYQNGVLATGSSQGIVNIWKPK